MRVFTTSTKKLLDNSSSWELVTAIKNKKNGAMLFGIETLGHIAPLPSQSRDGASFDAKILRRLRQTRLMQPCF